MKTIALIALLFAIYQQGAQAYKCDKLLKSYSKQFNSGKKKEAHLTKVKIIKCVRGSK